MDIQSYINNYIAWLKNEFTFTDMGEYYEITAPFLDSNNDYIQIYVKQQGKKIYFSDDGYTIMNLEAHGFALTPQRKKQLEYILSQFGVTMNEKELTMVAEQQSFPQKKHFFIQALLRVGDLYVTTRNRVSSIFLDDIVNFFSDNEIYYTNSIQLLGRSGFSHNYDFLLQNTKVMPTRFCVAMNKPSKGSMNNTLFIWSDTQNARKDDSQLIVFLNDQSSIPSGIEDGFKNYGVNTIRWSQRNDKKNLHLLTA